MDDENSIESDRNGDASKVPVGDSVKNPKLTDEETIDPDLDDEPGSVTVWINDLKNQKSEEALEWLWIRFASRLSAVASKRLKNSKCRINDGESVASEAFAEFFSKSPEDFEKLVNREDLWQILTMIAERRAIDAIRHENTKKLGGDHTIQDDAPLNFVPGKTSSPDMELILVEAVNERLSMLKKPIQRQLAVMRMEGHSNVEIAKRMGIKPSSVDSELKSIRRIWDPRGLMKKRRKDEEDCQSGDSNPEDGPI
ncbi:MAG: ECF-type sigma factor [Planctomycetota bacterium]